MDASLAECLDKNMAVTLAEYTRAQRENPMQNTRRIVSVWRDSSPEGLFRTLKGRTAKKNIMAEARAPRAAAETISEVT